MSALTMSARLGNDTALRPVPWRRMAWVTWRQHRFALTGVAGLLGALAAYLLYTGLLAAHRLDSLEELALGYLRENPAEVTR